MNIKMLLVLTAVMFSGIFGCDVADKGGGTLNKLDIADAASLFIASDNVLRKSVASADTTRLFKITADGFIEEVKYLDEDGDEMAYTHYPSDIYNLDESYVIVIFGDGTTGYLVRKDDGAVFTLVDAGIPWKGFGGYRNWPPVQTDAGNNAYYLVGEYLGEQEFRHRVIRIRLDNPARLTAQLISPTMEDIGYFLVNNSGDVFYNGLHINPRIIMSGGGLVNTPPLMSEFWLGGDRQFYGIEYQHQASQIKKLLIVNNALNAENYGEPNDFWFAMDHSTVLTLQDKVYIVSGEVFEVFNPAATPQRVENLGLVTIGNAVASDHYYYLSGNDEASRPTLIKVSAHSNRPETLLPPNDYDIYTMVVSHDDILTFSALRMSDGRRVIGEIDSNGQVTILDEEMGTNIIILERIN